MKKTEVIALLKSNSDERGVAHWNKRFAKDTNLKSFGIGLTKLRKLAKQIGKDPGLAARLWKSDVYDVKIIALLIDDPKVITEDQAEQQVEDLAAGHLAHVFSTCGAPLSKTAFAPDLANKWVISKDPNRRRCGYGLVSELTKVKTKKAPEDAYFLKHIQQIDQSFDKEELAVLLAMGGAIMSIGIRNKNLHPIALNVARKIGPIDFDPDGRCDPFDPVKHLTGDYVKQKLGV